MDNPEKRTKAFCTTREAAKLLGVSLRTVQLWSEAGLLDAWKTSGGHRRIATASVERMFLEQPALPAADAQSSTQSQLCVLVVEDDPGVLRVYERRISRWPMKPLLISAANGFDALVKIGLKKPDLLVMDLHMPEMDGFSMLRHLKAMPELADISIVVVTGLDAKAIQARGEIPAGIPVLPKPIPFDRLQDIATIVADRKKRLQLKSA